MSPSSLQRKLPIFFNFRARDNFKEDRVYRNLEPALAFQMEINRLRNYDLEPVPVLNRRMHMYLGQAKVRVYPLDECSIKSQYEFVEC